MGRILGRYSYFPVYSILELRGHDCWRFAPGVRSFSGYVDDTSLVTVNTVFAMAAAPVSDSPGACSNLYFRSPIEIFFSEIFLELFFETFFWNFFLRSLQLQVSGRSLSCVRPQRGLWSWTAAPEDGLTMPPVYYSNCFRRQDTGNRIQETGNTLDT